MYIDFHVHAFDDHIAEKALVKLSHVAKQAPCTNGTITDTIKKLDEWHINIGVVLPIATKPSQQTRINDWAKSICSDRIVAFGSVHFMAENVLEELERIHQLGLKGVKLHPDYQDFMIDDPRMFPIYQRCAELGLICVFHTGFDHISPNLIHASPKACAKIAVQFPNATFVFAHMGGCKLWDQVEADLCGCNAYFDLAYCAQTLSPEQAVRIIRKHGADKILFASDCPWQTSVEGITYVKNLGLTEEEEQLIFEKNALRLLGLSSDSIK